MKFACGSVWQNLHPLTNNESIRNPVLEKRRKTSASFLNVFCNKLGEITLKLSQ